MIKFVIAASLSSIFFGLFGVTWEKVDRKIADEYPGVQGLSSEHLWQNLTANSHPELLLVDVREPEEFLVSHIDSAVNLTSAQAIAQLTADRAAPIVVYCSVGYRSAGVAADLKELGYSNVQNLHHSLFEWANKGLPMVNASGSTAVVHPFNRAWGELLESSRRSYTP